MAELYRFAAFISYSSKDATFARRLHKALEQYRIPKSLGSFDLLGEGGKPNRVYPVFRDREELSAGDLGERIEAALRASSAVIVVCTPDSAASPWVQQEIEYFSALGRRPRIFTVIPDDAPSLTTGANPRACFPPALRGGGEPLAADARKGRDGFRGALLKLVAGLIDVNAGSLEDRDRRNRRWRLAQVTATAVSAIAILGLLSVAVLSSQLQERSTTLADLARRASDEGYYERAARYALAGLAGHDWPFIRVDMSAAEAELRRARVESPVISTFSNAIGYQRFNRDGSRILLAMRDSEGVLNSALLVDVRRGRAIATVPGAPAPGAPNREIGSFSPDGTLFITRLTSENLVSVWNAVDGRRVATLRHTGEIYESTFGNGSDRVVTVAADGMRVWDVPRGVELLRLTLPPRREPGPLGGSATRLSLSRDDSRIVATFNVGETRYETLVWDFPSGAIIATVAGIHNTTSADGSWIAVDQDTLTTIVDIQTGSSLIGLEGDCLSLSPDRTLAYTQYQGVGRVWRIADGSMVTTLGEGMYCFNRPSFSSDGTSLIAGNGIWETTSWQRLATLSDTWELSVDASRLIDGSSRLRLLNAHSGAVVAEPADIPAREYSNFSPSGRLLATTLSNDDVVLWDAASGRRMMSLRGHRGAVIQTDFSPQDDYAATEIGDSTRLWRLGRDDTVLGRHQEHIVSIASSADGSRLVSASRDGTATIWDSRTARAIRTLRHQGDAVISAAFSPDGSQLVTTSEDGTLRIWDAVTGRMQRAEQQGFKSAVFSPDGARIVTTSADQRDRNFTVRILDQAGFEVAAFPGDAAQYSAAGPWIAVSYSPDGSRIAVSRGARMLTLFDARNGRELSRLTGRSRDSLHDLSPPRIGFANDGERLFVVEGDTSVRIWDWRAGRETAVMEGHERIIWDAELSPAGDRLATASADGTAKIWDVSNGRELVTLRGHTDEVFDIGFDPSGRTVVTTSADGTTRLWDVASGHQVAILRRQSEGGFPRVVYSPDGEHVAATDGNVIRLWSVSPALHLERSELMRDVCENILPGENATLDEIELSQAPILDPILDADVCRRVGMRRRVRVLPGSS